MRGIYYYHILKKEWQWHIDYMGEQVASGICKDKGEMLEVIKEKGFASWEKF